MKLILRKELEKLETIQTKATHRTQVLTGMPSSHGGNHSMDAAIEYVDLERKLQAELELLDALRDERYQEALTIKNPKVREVMIRRYVYCQSWKAINKAMGISESSMYNYHAEYWRNNDGKV